MKTKKIIGLLIATGGVVASFAAAAALYTKGVNPVGFGIGAQYHGQDGSISYKISGANSGTVNPSYLKADGTNGGPGLNHEYTQVEYVFPLTAVYGKNPQDYVMGNFKFEILDIASQVKGNASVWVELKGFGDEYYQRIGAETLDDPLKHDVDHSAKWGSSAANVKFMNSDVPITNEMSEYSVDKDIAVETSGTQAVYVYIKFNSGTNASNMLDLAETVPFTVKATWGAPSARYEGAYVIGDGSDWKMDELYAMVPNMKASSFEWYYKGVTGWTVGKAVKDNHEGEDTWSRNYSDQVENTPLTASTTYNVVWNGNGDGLADYQAQA